MRPPLDCLPHPRAAQLSEPYVVRQSATPCLSVRPEPDTCIHRARRHRDRVGSGLDPQGPPQRPSRSRPTPSWRCTSWTSGRGTPSG